MTKFYISILLIAMVILFGVSTTQNNPIQGTMRDTIYPYQVELDSLDETHAFFGGGSYFFQYTAEDKEVIEKVASFPWESNYYASASGWGLGHGLQAMSLSNRSKLPDGFYIKWYSPFENQRWEAKGDFDFDFFRQLEKHYVEMPFNSSSSSNFFLKYFNFVVNAGPEGRLAIWIVGKGQQYLLVRARANSLGEGSQGVISPSFPTYGMTSEETAERRIKTVSAKVQEDYKNNNMAHYAELWDRRMKRYNWHLMGNEHFGLLESLVSYSNGERLTASKEGKIAFRDRFAAPKEIFIFLINRKDPKHQERLRVRVNEEEMMKVLETLTKDDPDKEVHLKLDVSEDLKILSLIAFTDNESIEVMQITAKLFDLKRKAI